jgi:hypothetical protein
MPPASFRQTPLGRALGRLFRLAASLQLAIVLLAFFTGCLALATLLESHYSAAVAQNLVYRTWWFALLLTLLAVNILCAALKKYPWKRHQTGFLITHLGLEVLIFGGLLTALFGVEGMMVLVDTDSEAIQGAAGAPQAAHSMVLSDRHSLEMVQLTAGDLRDRTLARALRTLLQEDGDLSPEQSGNLGRRYCQMSFNPGSFAWHADEYFQPRLPWGLQMLKALADPFPGLQASLPDQTQLVLENYYPHTERCPVRDGRPGEKSFPAVHLQLNKGERSRSVWALGCVPQVPGALAVNLDVMELREPALLNEFLTPPEPGSSEMGKDGQLVVAVGSGKDARLFRLPVDCSRLEEAVALPDTELHVKLLAWDHLSRFDDAERLGSLPQPRRQAPQEFPTLKLEITGRHGTGTYLACARLPHRSGLLSGDPGIGVSLWYHYPDFRWGRPAEAAPETLQLLQGPAGKLYYRFFAKDGLARKGQPIDTDPDQESFSLPSEPLPMHFRVTAHKPRAVAEPGCAPRQVEPGVEAPGLQPALRFSLTAPEAANGGAGPRASEYWVRMGEPAVKVDQGRSKLIVRYRRVRQALDFGLKLNRAREVKDPGSDRAAAFESEVTLLADQKGQAGSTQRICMNHPLACGPYKIYQASYEVVHSPRGPMRGPTGWVVSRSGLQICHDPGLWFKYAGSLLVAGGISVMFFMKAYFFKPKQGTRSAVEE